MIQTKYLFKNLRNHKLYVVGAFLLLSFLLLGPLLKPGYILTFDMVFAPHMPAPTSVSNTFLVEWLIHLSTLVVPGWVVQKILLLGIFTAMGMGSFRLAGRGWAGWFAGLLYVLNPYTYTRFINGQYYVLLGMAVLPWVLVRALKLRQEPSLKMFGWLLGVFTLLGIVSIHLLVISLLPLFLLLFSSRSTRVWLLALLVGFFVTSSYWLLPTLLGHSSIANAIEGFSQADFDAYRTVAAPHAGVLLNTASMHGFWADTSGRYATGQSNLWLWLLPYLLLLALSIFGLYRERHSVVAWIFAGSALVALVLAVGESWSGGAPLTHWLYAHSSLYWGFREPQKWTVLLVLAYAYLGGKGIVALRQQFRQASYAIAGLFVLPLLLAPYMLWGADGQLRSTWYPADWYTVKQEIGAQTSNQTLFLPWHQYLHLGFAGRVVANPAPLFFDQQRILSGDNAEIGRIYSSSTRPDSVAIQQLLARHTTVTDAGLWLAPLHIHYIILAKEADYEQYSWLAQQRDLTLINDTPTLQLYRNDAY